MPWAMIWPPCTPAPGPMSITWSAARIASSSCSTTSTLLPMSRRCLQRADQAVVVALVQADRRFVEHVHHAGQARADLRRQPDALRLAARQRVGAAVQRQVVQADVVQELQARQISLTTWSAISRLGAVQLQRLEEVERFAQRRCRDFVDRALLRARGRLSRWRASLRRRVPCAGRALLLADELRELFAHRHRIGFAVAPLQVGHDAFEGVLADHACGRARCM